LRWIHWESPEPDTFSEDELRRVAGDNGWKFLGREFYAADSMTTWSYHGTPVFPLNFPEHGGSVTVQDVQEYPRHIMGPCTVLRFDSGWIREDPGTNETSTAFGYVVLGEDGRKLAIYHFWGNG